MKTSSEPGQKKLITLMVRQNAQRLAQIVDEVLNISRVQHDGARLSPAVVRLDDAVRQVCTDWNAPVGMRRDTEP